MNTLTPSRLMIGTIAGITLALAGCASDRSANIYMPSEALNEARVREGMVESIRPVKIQSDSEIGKIIGAVIGGVAVGGNVGKGNGSIVSGVLGAAAGGAVGNALGKEANSKDGVELVLKMDNGEVIAVVQESDITFVPGQKIRVITRGRVSRVVPAG
ncbi:outer membrane lipoprotein [Chitinimonas naiadis]